MRFKVLLLTLKYLFRVLLVCFVSIGALLLSAGISKELTGDPTTGVILIMLSVGLTSVVYLCYYEARKKVDIENSRVFKILKDSK